MVKRKIEGKRITMIFVLGVFIIVTSLQCVSAFGISPAKYTQFFEPDKAYMYSFWVVNKENKNMSVDISVEGELKDYITILNESINLKDDEIFEKVFFMISYPSSIGSPGAHTASIVFSQSGKDDAIVDMREEDMIHIVPVIKAVFETFVPYPGKYLEYNMSIESTNEKQPVKVIFPLSNKGLIDFDSVYADIELLDGEGNLIEHNKTSIIPVKSQKQGKLEGIFDSQGSGSYGIKAVLHYDGKSAEFEEEFDYGKWTISIEDIRVEEFKLGDFADFDIILKNNWNMDAEGVIADFIITNMKGYEYTSVTSFSTIPAKGSASFRGYWDSSDALPGEYYLTLNIYYADKKQHYSQRITVEDKRIITRYYTPPEPVVVGLYKKILPEKYRGLIKYLAYPVIILILLILTFTLLIRVLPFIESGIAKISFRKPIKIMHSVIKYVGSHIPELDFIEKLKRKKRIRKLKKLKKKYMQAIASARKDIFTMKKAVNGLYNELEKRKVIKKEFDKRLLTILEEKPLIWWEDHYAKLIIKLEDKIKEINKKIWEEG